MFTEEIKATQTKIGLIMQVVVGLPLDEFARAIEYSNSIGPLIDPTAWMDNAQGITEWRELVKPLIEFQRVAKRLVKPPEEGEDD